MKPYYADDWLTVYVGDCRLGMASLPNDSVDCVVTSPPYWGLRDYGTATWVGGDADHEHRGMIELAGKPGSAKQASKRGSTNVYSGDCACGAHRADSQLGLESTPEQYVANMVAVFREVRRVLKPSGTCWLNLGDSYAGGNGLGRNDADRNFTGGGGNHAGSGNPGRQGKHDRTSGLKPKDLVGIPWRVAFALQADGWYLRSDIIWSKPNPMPESVTDRPTKSHEYLFLLTKSPRYYFDADAVKERGISVGVESIDARDRNADQRKLGGATGKESHASGTRTASNLSRAYAGVDWSTAGRNVRSVWTIATRPYPGAHFAVFPPELPERCIKAGSSERGVCPECGAPWERVVEREKFGKAFSATKYDHTAQAGPLSRSRQAYRAAGLEGPPPPTLLGWRPSCRHETLKPSPAVILDPFGGSGTVGMVANRLSRRAILIDLNPEYLKQQMRRNAQTPLGLAEPA